MKNNTNKILILILFLLPLPLFFLSSTSAITLEDNSLQDVINAGKIVVGIEAAHPPFEQINPVTSEIEGFDPDIMEYIADDIGVSIEWVDVSWSYIFTGLDNGDYDCIISAVTITENRETEMDFSRWYYRKTLAIMVNDDNPKGIENLDDVNSTDIKVGVQAGTSGELYIDDEGIVAEEILFATTTLAIEALTYGTIDVVLGDFAVLMDNEETNSEPLYIIDTFNEEEFGIPLQTGSDSLRLRINQILDELLGENKIRPEPNTYYSASHEEWFGIQPYLDFKGDITYYTINASSGDNGIINPEGEISVKEGDDILFNFTSDENYLIDKVTIDGTSIGNPSNYTFNDIDLNHTIVVDFVKDAKGFPFEIPGYSIIYFIIISFAVVSIITVKIHYRRFN